MPKRIHTLPWILIVLVIPAFAVSQDTRDSLIGTWEYRQANSGRESGYDREGEKIEFRRSGDSVAGFYFGVERQGEEGLYYSAVQVVELAMDANGQIGFVVPGRDFFIERPKSIEEAMKRKDESNGFTKYPLRYTGSIVEGVLVLHCSTKNGNCPDNTLEFYKGRWR